MKEATGATAATAATGAGSAWVKWLGGAFSGALAGALAMYLSDPDRGRRRRALLRDKLQHLATSSGDALDVALRDAGNRLQGMFATTNRRLLGPRAGADDAVLAERVRARIGRAIAHPHPVRVDAQRGHVVLSGPVLAHEKEALLRAVKSVPGVSNFEDRLDVHQRQDGIPSLQGEGRHRQARYTVLQQNWPPAVRAAALIGGGAIGYYGLTRRAPANLLMGVIGASLAFRAMNNRPLLRLGVTYPTGPQPIDLYKTVHVEAAPDVVFDLWSRYENFPRFMSNVQEVRDLGTGRSHWIVSGPAGSQIEWDAVLTESIRPWVLAWKSEPGAIAEHSGAVHFEPADTGTRVSVQLSYRPPADAAGQAFASMFDGNPVRQLAEDLLHMKTFIESRTSVHETTPEQQAGQTLH